MMLDINATPTAKLMPENSVQMRNRWSQSGTSTVSSLASWWLASSTVHRIAHFSR
ncbi:hypothetical protein D3C71_2079090 [compost metagenome]